MSFQVGLRLINTGDLTTYKIENNMFKVKSWEIMFLKVKHQKNTLKIFLKVKSQTKIIFSSKIFFEKK